MLKRTAAMMLTAALLLGLLTACKGAEGGMVDQNGVGVTETATVQEKVMLPADLDSEAFARVVDAYRAETGATLTVETLAADDYARRLETALKSGDAPLLFVVHGDMERAAVAKYCAPLEAVNATAHLDDAAFALAEGGHTYALPLRYETFGLIYNKDVLASYFALTDRKTAYQSMAEINSLSALRALAEDLDAHKEQLGIEAAFSSAPLKEEETHAWHTQLFARLAGGLHAGDSTRRSAKDSVADALDRGDLYGDFLNFWYGHAVTRDSGADEAQAVSEFAAGRSAMMLSSAHNASALLRAEGSKLTGDQIDLHPVYLGAVDESGQGIGVSADQYLCVHAQASEAQRDAAEKFLDWLLTGETGRQAYVEAFGSLTPYDHMIAGDLPEDAVMRERARELQRTEVQPVRYDADLAHNGPFSALLRGAAAALQSGARAWEDLKADISEGVKDIFG